MKSVNSITRMATLVKIFKKEGKSIGFVPTMGYLHNGHLSLVRAARKHTDIVVMSIFVNPLQFGPKEDFENYPRDIKRDEILAEDVGVDVIFCPEAKEMYPEGFATRVNVDRLSNVLCGKSRIGHFAGVATVVAKLFNIIKPDVAYFGQKDAQQAAVIRQMVRDLNLDIEIKTMPVVRESDGLAMSSRNVHLSEEERRQALALRQSLDKAETLVRAGQVNAEKIVREMKNVISEMPLVKVDYVSIVNPKDLKDIDRISGEALIAVAALVGKTRLIDNIIVKAQK